jgi:hypothetical protein
MPWPSALAANIAECTDFVNTSVGSMRRPGSVLT